jgi:hypothetical protein
MKWPKAFAWHIRRARGLQKAKITTVHFKQNQGFGAGSCKP